MDELRVFLADQRVAALGAVVVLGLANLALAVFASRPKSWGGDGSFSLETLPRFVDTLLVRKTFMLGVLGMAALATAGDLSTGLWTLYFGSCATVVLGELAQLRANYQGLPDMPTVDPTTPPASPVVPPVGFKGRVG